MDGFRLLRLQEAKNWLVVSGCASRRVNNLAEDHYVKLLKITGRLENTEIAATQQSMEEVKKEVGKVPKALSEEMTELRGALDKEKAERKRENEALENKLESKIVSGRKKTRNGIVSERKKIEDESSSIRVNINSMKTGSGGPSSSAASAGYGLGSGTFAQPPMFARWQSEWSLRKTELKGWVTDWSQKHIQGTRDDDTEELLDQIRAAMGDEFKAHIRWEHSKENQAP